jgi:C-terminal processing protease CtpA/Prc
MNRDLDLLISSLKEAHTGLYTYNTPPQFDSICSARRSLIKPVSGVLDFYNIIAPIIAFTREAHTYLQPGAETRAYLQYNGKYFPLYLKFLAQKPYLINDAGGFKLRGLMLTKINGRGMDEIMHKFLSYEPSDGYNMTGKYRWIEENAKFSAYYALCYPQTSFFDIEVLDPATGKTRTIKHIPALGQAEYKQQYKAVTDGIPNATYKTPATLKIDTVTQIAALTFNSFDADEYDDAQLEFHSFVKDAFAKIKQQNIKHLVIDIRKNGGGAEGYEDYLLSFMIDKDYVKYKYVQASAFSYSFYRYTNYQSKPQRLETMLKREHYLSADGRILRKPGVMAHTPPQPDPFKGDIYVITSGLTYSGGSEFAALMHNYTNARFIGEEAGGGYYGNTSGNRIVLTLPNSKLVIGIPILKFVLETPKADEPAGHGIMPDYPVQPTIAQFLSGYDAEMEFAKTLIRKNAG